MHARVGELAWRVVSLSLLNLSVNILAVMWLTWGQIHGGKQSAWRGVSAAAAGRQMIMGIEDGDMGLGFWCHGSQGLRTARVYDVEVI